MRTDIEEPVTKLNEELPPTIRIVDITKATKSFDAKNHCSHRTYEYVTPTFAFAPIDQVNDCVQGGLARPSVCT